MGRLTSHGEVVFEPVSTMGTRHGYWGDHKDVWPHALGAAPQATGGCGCGAQPATPAATLDAWFAAAKAPSDFHEHVETVRDLAARCAHVTQIGSWGKPSRQALAAGLPPAGRFVDYAPMGRPEWKELEAFLGDRFAGRILLDGTAREIDPTDLLFHDTAHTAAAVYADLARLHGKVAKYIVVHTTETFGEAGDDGGPGVMPGLRRFLKEFPAWTAVRHDKANHGLIVLSKVEAEKTQPPGLMRKALNFAKALAAHAQAGQKLVGDERWELRMAECLTCPNRTHDVCGLCGCPVEKKTSWAEQQCPADPPRWTAEQQETAR